jgi:integrase
MNQYNGKAQHEPSSDKVVLAQLCAALPPLPSVLRYHDEFTDSVHSIRNPENVKAFELMLYGRSRILDFSSFSTECAVIFKHVFAYLIAQNLNVGTVYTYLCYAHLFTSEDVTELVSAEPTGIGIVWKALRGRELQPQAYKAAKSLLHLLCAYRLHGWSQDYHAFLSTALPLPSVDKYAAVRSGDVFLSAEEEALIVRHLDDMAEQVRRSQVVSYGALEDAAMLLCAYQFAMRPIQIGMLDVCHIRIWNDEISDEPTVHLTFHMAKQRGTKSRLPLTRRVKREWVSIFVRLKANFEVTNEEGSTKFFRVKSSQEVGTRIAELVRRLINSDDIGSATDLRHTAAQRLVDAGASHEELAEFLGHAQTNTGLVYYATSASHAERVNKALGESDVYRRVAKIAHDRFISSDELSQLKEEQQVAAVPHGIPITGIGGCQSGQPGCPYNPVTSCYGCRKFMPVNDRTLHEKVLGDMRETVLFFESSSRSNIRTPTYMQLQRTIAEIQTVIDELQEGVA